MYHFSKGVWQSTSKRRGPLHI